MKLAITSSLKAGHNWTKSSRVISKINPATAGRECYPMWHFRPAHGLCVPGVFSHPYQSPKIMKFGR
jgi:hypothetical protein